MNPIKYLLLLCCWPVFLQAQNDLGIGEWRQYLPFSRGLFVTQSQQEVFFSSDGGIVAIDKENNGAVFYNKINRLTDFGTRVIGYHTPTASLLVTYDNGNIDILGPNGTTNLPFIKSSSNIVGLRRVNHLFFDEEGAFLSTSFGISRIDMTVPEFTFTTLTGVPVEAVTRFQDNYYAATEEGIYRISVNAINPADFNNWTLLEGDQGFPVAYAATALATYEGRLYAGMDDGLYVFDGDTLLPLITDAEKRVRFLTAEGQNLLMGWGSCPDCDDWEVLVWDANGQINQYGSACVNRPTYAIEDEVGNIWFADQWLDYRVSYPGQEGCGRFRYNTPARPDAYSITLDGDRVYLAAGGIAAAQQYTWNANGVYLLEGDDTWTEINRGTVPAMNQMWDFVDVAIHPNNDKLYIAAFLEGLVEIDADQALVYNEKNSSLNNAIGDTSRTRCPAIDFDPDNNLWVANHEAERYLSVLQNDGTWKSFRPPFSNRSILDVMSDPNGYIWMILARGNTPVLILDPGESIEDESDDRYRFFSASNSELPVNGVNSMEVDLDGNVWIGTTDGAVVFDCGLGLFEDFCTGNQPITEVDGIPARLLETEVVNTIAVDGANRKWFGTNNGIFVQSPDGTEQILEFNIDNSPLPSNIINDIEINPTTGVAYIATGAGLMSYKGDATGGGVINRSEVIIYPNPVRPDYNGPIAIKGLARDADIKITDAQGRLVFETTALGGQAIWDGRDYNGRKANSGVYLVFSTAVRNTTNPDAVIGKILFINGGQ